MTTLAMGANAPLSGQKTTLTVEVLGGSADVTALQLYADGKVRGDGDMCFFNQTSIGGGTVSLSVSGSRSSFELDLGRIAQNVEKIVFTAALEQGTFGSVSGVKVSSSERHELAVETAGRSEAALILAEIYRRNGQWKLRNVSQGFNGGLQAIAEYFGVEVTSAAPTPPPAPGAAQPKPAAPPPVPPQPAPKPVSLSKVSLTKNERTVSLKKKDGRFGRIQVNLNWNQKKKSGGLFGLGKTGIDLDLGAFVEFKDGYRNVVQALGNSFGSFGQEPYVQLKGDDRTGAVTDGEWLEINGDKWPEFKRVLIYAFIYEGVANWAETDGVIRLMVPGQPEVEVRMNEVAGDSRDGMCAIALLENMGGEIKVSREVRFFRGHKFMDEAYGFGFRWTAGSK
ncbi:TerD family protein [Salipiger marinus]|uniref:Tellurite resistance protein TerA n=1 Tax=Salipiger marinus TaxID=555512 RepID=A0A1G8UQX4_9RHOB|nr:TerD family protein [Salipiger marinus]SDJ56139.1 tellurite resistance protein TerA [Salipiger marinus]